jgi:hypothetical protein
LRILHVTYDCRSPDNLFRAVEFEVKIGDTRLKALEVGMKGACSRRVLVRDPLHLFFQALVK